MNNLPTEILLHIFSYLPTSDLVVCVTKVCARWNTLTFGHKLWRNRDVYLPEDEASVQDLVKCFPKLQSVSMVLVTDTRPGRAWIYGNRLYAVIRTRDCFLSFLTTIIKNGDNIIRLSVSGVDDGIEDVLKIIANLPNLHTLDLMGSCPAPLETAKSFSLLPFLAVCGDTSGWLSNLRTLTLDNVTHVDDKVVAAICRYCPLLKDLAIHDSKINGEGLKYLHCLQDLETLDLSGCYYLKFLGTLSQCVLLLHLDLAHCWCVRPREIAETVPRIRWLQELNLTCCDASQLCLRELPHHLPYLRCICLWEAKVDEEQLETLKLCAPHIDVER